jgi:hypothetical protein
MGAGFRDTLPAGEGIPALRTATAAIPETDPSNGSWAGRPALEGNRVIADAAIIKEGQIWGKCT